MMNRAALGGVLLVLFAIGPACRRVHYTVANTPPAPSMLGSFKIDDPEIPAAVELTNFSVGVVDTQYSEDEKQLFRRTIAVMLPNALQETLGRRQVFAQVARVETPVAGRADYVISGNYDFFERLGTQGREWIPYAGLFGARINEASVRGTTRVVVQDMRTGVMIMDKTFTEEHNDRTSVYRQPVVGYLQADHLAQISEEIIAAIRASATSRSPDARRSTSSTAGTHSEGDALAERLRNLEGLRRDGLISDREYRDRRKRMLDDAF